MAVTVSGTSITFNDATVQTTAAGAPTTAQVLTATSGASPGAVGSYTFYARIDNSWSSNSTIAGSTLGFSGTWRAMGPSWLSGTILISAYDRVIYAGIWLRIS